MTSPDAIQVDMVIVRGEVPNLLHAPVEEMGHVD